MNKTLVSLVIFVRNITPKSLELWMQVREVEGPLKGLLEFPGGKLEAGESPWQAAVREIQEEVGVQIHEQDLMLIKQYETSYSKPVLLFPFLCLKGEGLNENNWFELSFEAGSRLFKGKIPEVNHLIIDELLAYFKEQTSDGNTERLKMLWDYIQN
jgi:8-oxo-dGTP diphosphatase